uniref:Basic phospholipase A2 myotoxin I n=1 Tax=Bothrops asper TaxID=8722 RepID=PA2B3_BOTAS|nr:RecName: Full=Basic phospholipase A2 myotoxin I; Short=MT-I; Short=svPLA2; AltName: Full=Myotoxic phospholipase; AltName: Full=Myotoxin III; AltName: Full=Phosphatidylcholine 2-acylhydrolase; Flags: Precursor [Bothrops asper]
MRTLWIMAVLLVGVEGSLIEFAKMILEETKRLPFPYYTTYGCYCGWGGQGQPKDATDRCCFVHDCCYGKLSNCKPKTDRYSYSRKSGVIICGEGTPCEKQICECDKAAAVCFRENLRTYKKRYMAYPDLLCKKPAEKC